MSTKKSFLIVSLIILLIMGICGTAGTKSADYEITPLSHLTGAMVSSENIGTQAIEGLIETTPDDPDWALVTSQLILRENLCEPSNWYDRVFNPCYYPYYTRYWRLESSANVGKAFTMAQLANPSWTFDGLYVREGFGFQLYYNTEEPNDPCDLEPASPWMCGPQYVSIDCWRDTYPAPDGFEPNTFFVSGGPGALSNYSIIIDRSCGPGPCLLYLTKVDDVNDGDCVGPGDDVNYTISYSYNGDVNCSDINDVNIIDELPEELDFNSASAGGIYDSNTHTVMWNIGTLSPGESGFVTLKVKVKCAEPGGKITNHCEMKGDCIDLHAEEYTNVCCWRGTIIYVDADANGHNDGTSWRDAYNYLQDAFETARESLSAGCSCEEILVAEGTYRPDQNSVYPNGTRNRMATFELINGIAIKGGYAGLGEPNQPNPNARDIRQYETILSGDLKRNDRQDVDPCDLLSDPCRSENSYHVVTGSGTNGTTILDGFTITGGNANGTGTNNSGGGMYNYDSNSTITNCIFIGNSAAQDGGGIYNTVGDPNIVNCVFVGNWAGYSGGGMRNHSYPSKPKVTNCTFTGNSSGIFSGSGHFSDDITMVTNCILWGNEGGQISGGYVTVTYSDIQGGLAGTGNINADPWLEADGYHLTLCSPCINAGDPNGDYEDQNDIDGEDRIVYGRVDMGADEYYPADYNELLRAHCPRPACGETDVPQVVVLSWRPGLNAADVNGHKLYFSSNYNEVKDRTADKHVLSDPCYPIPSPPTPLALGKTYYWVVDEVNDGNTWPGCVWHFRTANYLVVDDFESYLNDFALDNIWCSWPPGYSITIYGDHLPNDENDPNLIHSGNKSMKIWYFGDSEVDALTGGGEGELLIGSDWTVDGVKALTLYFYGDPCNAVLPMYVVLNNSDYKKYYSAPNDLKIKGWHEWNIALADFGVDLTNVTDIAIGFDAGAGWGTLYFDDIRLYRPRCVPEGPTGDLNWDCVVNFRDFAVLANEWLDTGCCEADLYKDNKVDFKDLAIMADNWLEEEELWP
ncbi:MAG: hypothetical protein WAK60_05120 [Sedimentisphaerales bacterium]